ncbi:MAG: hypothetical protein JO099_22080 [Acidobacteriia bacterium]|nr:hypothetical protein [Terriglobia bacterium]
MAQITSVKDVQAHLRHTNAKTTLEHSIKSVPESVRVAVESLDRRFVTVTQLPAVNRLTFGYGVSQ